MYLHSKTHKPSCSCKNQTETKTEINSNPLKIFKNQVNYSTKMGKNLYYDTVDDKNDIYCDDCNAKYTCTDQKYAPC